MTAKISKLIIILFKISDRQYEATTRDLRARTKSVLSSWRETDCEHLKLSQVTTVRSQSLSFFSEGDQEFEATTGGTTAKAKSEIYKYEI